MKMLWQETVSEHDKRMVTFRLNQVLTQQFDNMLLPKDGYATIHHLCDENNCLGHIVSS